MTKFGIKCCLNSDNILLSGDDKLIANPTNEIIKYITELGADWKDIKDVLMNGATLSFDKTIDEEWLNKFEIEIDSVINSVINDLSENVTGNSVVDGRIWSKL